MKFKIGDKVIYTSGVWGSGASNPLYDDYKIVGVIDHFGDDWIGVQWPNGIHNTYNEGDLELYNAPVTLPKELFEL